MSAVAGLVHLDGGRASYSELNHLLTSLGHWGRAAHANPNGDACLAAIGSSGFVPQVCLEGSAVITVAARLDNRAELLHALGGDLRERDSASDELLVVRAFERWQERCPDRLMGDWSMAVWRPAERRLFLARDHFGNTGLFYARCGERLVFASDVNAMKVVPWIPRRLDETRIASLLVGGGVDDPSSTVFRDITRVPPAHVVTITASEQRATRYWCVEETPDAGPASAIERAGLLRNTLRAAVKSRLGDDLQLGSMLSGGLDSGAVTALAAEALRAQHRRLTAFTAVPAYPTKRGAGGGATDEGPAAAQVVRAFDSIDHVLISASAVTPLTGIRRGLAIHGEPLLAAANYAWITELLADARARGITRLFTGQVGDFVMAGRPASHSFAADWSSGNYRAMVKSAAPNWVLRLRRADWKPWRLGEVPWQTFSVINPAFADELKLVERMRDAGRDPRMMKSQSRAAAVVRQATSHVGAVAAPLGAAYGMTMVDPLQDKRVMDLMFSAPRPAEAAGVNRWLFRESLTGVLPDDVRLSRTKGMQSSDIVERLLASWSEVEEALSLAAASPLARRCIDVPYCRALATSIRTGPDRPHARRRSFLLANGLAAALFLAENWEQAASHAPA
jgi:asparagine synthase (glutamine-hydrolysing)